LNNKGGSSALSLVVLQFGGKEAHMKKNGGRERRKKSRADATVVVSYHLLEEDGNYDLSQTRNISQGGMLLTTNRKFEKGARLGMTIQFPFLKDKIQVVGEVVNSREMIKDVIYETRVMFYNLKSQLLRLLGDFVVESQGPKSNE